MRPLSQSLALSDEDATLKDLRVSNRSSPIQASSIQKTNVCKYSFVHAAKEDEYLLGILEVSSLDNSSTSRLANSEGQVSAQSSYCQPALSV